MYTKALFTFLVSCLLSCRSQVCDDCIHYALKISTIDAQTAEKVLDVRTIIVSIGTTIDTLDSQMIGIDYYDSAYIIPGNAGIYSLKLIQNKFETIELTRLRVDENECNVITKKVTVQIDKILSRRAINSESQLKILSIEDKDECG